MSTEASIETNSKLVVDHLTSKKGAKAILNTQLGQIPWTGNPDYVFSTKPNLLVK